MDYEHSKIVAIQLHAVFDSHQIQAIIEMLYEVSDSDFQVREFADRLADTGMHGPIRKDVCSLCGRPV